MTRRKPNNPRARMERACRALLSTNHVAVVQIDPAGRQGMINWKTCKSIPPGQRLADAVCDIPHRWTIYFSVFCVDPFGKRYIKSAEVEPQGIYLAGQLEEVIETYYRQLLDTCNPKQIVGSGWIANPCGVSLSEEQAARVFDAVGVWNIQLPGMPEQESAA